MESFCVGEGKMEQKNVPTITLGENIKSFKYYTNYDIHYFLVLKWNVINIFILCERNLSKHILGHWRWLYLTLKIKINIWYLLNFLIYSKCHIGEIKMYTLKWVVLQRFLCCKSCKWTIVLSIIRIYK